LLRSAEIRGSRLGVACALMVVCASLPAAARHQGSDDGTAKKPVPKSTPAQHAASSKSSSSAATSATSAHTAARPSSRKKRSVRARGQQKIDSERAQEIQQALVRAHYLSTPTGTWNQASEDAMRRYQADHGWQSKTVPDSRARISLGLGPSKDHLLNPESAMTTVPEKPHVVVPAPPAPRIQSTPAQSSPATVPTPAQTDPSRPQ
jgi:hypothetical protein